MNPTDYSRWKETTDSWSDKNPARIRITAHFIAPGSTVLDIGAGSMVLKKYLHPDCIYQPCDLYSRSPDCLVADLNEHQFPQGHFDWVTLIGVFQFLKDPAWVVRQCLTVADKAVFTFSPTINDPPSQKEILWRKGEGWITHYTRSEYISVVEAAGWKIINGFKIPANLVLICKAK